MRHEFRRDQLKHMIQAETCRLSTVRSQSVRDEITAHLQALRQADCKTHDGMMQLVRQRDELHNATRLLALVGVAPFVHRSGTMIAPARIQGGRASVRNAFYMAAVTASRHNPVLAPSTPA